MIVKLDLRHNAFNSIYQGLIHLEKAISDDYKSWSKEIKFHHDEQVTTIQKNGKQTFLLGDLYYIPPRYYEMKFSILHFVHGIELLLLDIVKTKNADDIFDKGNKNKTINFWKALNLSQSIIPGLLNEKQLDSLEICKDLRNNLEHYEVQSNYNELFKINSQLISIINCIFRLHFKFNLVKFYEFDCWEDEFSGKFTFTINHVLQDLKKSKDFNYKLLENRQNLEYCLYCNEYSYSQEENNCLFCLTEIDDDVKNML